MALGDTEYDDPFSAIELPTGYFLIIRLLLFCLLTPPGGIAIRRVCWCVVCVCVRSFVSVR